MNNDSFNIMYQRIVDIHKDGYDLCMKHIGQVLNNSGNMGIFCQNDTEYESFLNLSNALTFPSNNPMQKYYELRKPIIIPAYKNVPAISYNYLYIRKPDSTPYGKFTGDIDFYLDSKEYDSMVSNVKANKIIGATLYEQAGVGTMIELASSDFKAVTYISTLDMCESIRVKH